MDGTQSPVFTLLFIMWGFITVVLIALLSYRATLSMEENYTSIDVAEQKRLLEKQAQALIVQRYRLTGEIIALTVLSGGLLLTSAGFEIYYSSIGHF